MESGFSIGREVALMPPADFTRKYVRAGKPVVMKGALMSCSAVSQWTFQRLRDQAGRKPVPLKHWYGDRIGSNQIELGEYLDQIEGYEARLRQGIDSAEQRPAYLHDVPLTSIIPEPSCDLAGFPAMYFGSWYGGEWWRFAQFFLGPTHSVTPLHFDCLLTNNLFFQISGRKCFTLLPWSEKEACYRYRWRWFHVDPEQPDLARYPLFRRANPIQVIVEPGDVLYMPPGTLHHVRTLECGISFNVDWHTRWSALYGVMSIVRGMPLKNVYYNSLLALGMWLNLPSRQVFSRFRSYLNYVS